MDEATLKQLVLGELAEQMKTVMGAQPGALARMSDASADFDRTMKQSAAAAWQNRQAIIDMATGKALEDIRVHDLGTYRAEERLVGSAIPTDTITTAAGLAAAVIAGKQGVQYPAQQTPIAAG